MQAESELLKDRSTTVSSGSVTLLDEDDDLLLGFEDFIEPEPEEPPSQAITLRPYQIEANDALCSPPKNVWRQLLVLATGGGKTIVAADLIHRLISAGKRVLFLAHREELIDQAATKISWYIPDAFIEREKGPARASRQRMAALAVPHVVVGSIQSLHKRRREEFDPASFDLVICDETHHATAQSYRSIFEYFGCFDEEVRTPLIGVTATPDRSDKSDLSEIFQREAYRKDLAELIKEGYLCDIRAKRVNSTTDLSGVGVVRGDFDPKALAEAVDSAERNALIVQAYLKFASDRKCIVFAASVAHAQRLAELFQQNGVASEAIWGDLDKDLRKQRLKDFKDGKIQVLTNNMVLCEGYDEPSIGCVILGRPTKSPSLLLQIIGRGTRLHEGKEYVLILDIQDKGKSRALTVASAFGLPENFVEDDVPLAEAGEMMKDLDPGLRDKALDFESLKKIHAKVRAGLDAEEIDILQRREAEEQMKAQTSLRWRKSGDGYVLDVTKKIEQPDGTTKRAMQRYQLEKDTLGNWRLHWLKDEHHRIAPDSFKDLKAAFGHWDPFIENRHTNMRDLIRNDAGWLSKPAAPKQLESLFAFGVFGDPTEIPPELTKGEAAALLDDANARGMKYSFRRVPLDFRTRAAKEWKPKRRRKAPQSDAA